MRAVIFDAFGALPRLAEVPIPEPSPHGAVIKVMATGLCRSDWHGWQGHDPDITTLPHIPGHEFAGFVHAIGADVTSVRVGDRVVIPFVCGCGTCSWCVSGNAQVCPQQWQPGFNGPGSFAEFVAVPWADFNAVPLPADITFAVAASLGCRFATSYRAIVDVACVQPGESVAVFGCGGVGLAAVMIAAARRARVFAIDTNAQALDLARRAGAHHVINAASADAIIALRDVQPEGVDVTIDALGSIPTTDAAVRSLRIRGRHVQIGLLPPAEIGDRATVPMHIVIGRELQILGSHGMAAQAFPEMLDDIVAGILNPGQFITKTIELNGAPVALADMSRESSPGVTVITPHSERSSHYAGHLE